MIFLFEDDSNSKISKDIINSLYNKIELFNFSTIQSRLEEIVKQWINVNVCIDNVESEIIINPLL